METKELKILEKSIKYKFKDDKLLALAMTHRSHSGMNNERLEFLGDSILNFVVADLLFKKFNDLDEGDLSRLRSQLVKEEPLSKLGNGLKIGDFLNFENFIILFKLLPVPEIKTAVLIFLRPVNFSIKFNFIFSCCYFSNNIRFKFIC